MASRTFADALKEARLAAGLSQNALARRAGLTGSYISLLESQRRPPPSPKVIRSLCRTLGIEDKPLLEAAALERSPPTVRRRLERMRKERGRVLRGRDQLLTTTLFHLSRRPRVVEPMAEFLDLPLGQQALLGRLLGRVRKVRTLDEAESEAEHLLEDTTPRDRDALVRVLPRALGEGESTSPDETLPVVEPEPIDDHDAEAERFEAVPVHESARRRDDPREVRPVLRERWSPDLYFWRARGDDAHPRVEAGDLLLVDPGRAAQDGDLVLHRHEKRIRLGTYRRRGDEVQLVFPRPEIPPLRLAAGTFLPLGVVLEIRRALG